MKLHIKNFRSIKKLDLELAPITVLYGHNGTGKSSALYAPLTMKNIVVDPFQNLSGFFNYGFTSLGEFSEVVFDHNPDNELELGITLPSFYPSNDPDDIGYPSKLDYRIACSSNSTGFFQIVVTLTDWDGDNHTMFSSTLAVAFPIRRSEHELISASKSDKIFAWNGICASEVTPKSDDERMNMSPREMPDETIQMLNLPAEQLWKVNFVPLGRGFFPTYVLFEA